MKIKLRGIRSSGNIHVFELNKTKNMHRIIIKFLCELGYSEDAIKVVDQNIETKTDEYLFKKDNGRRVDICIFRDSVMLIVELEDKETKEIAKKYFSF